jgi:hypothetical protein
VAERDQEAYELLVEDQRHRELVDAVRPSWRRDIFVAAISAFFGLLDGYLLAILT